MKRVSIVILVGIVVIAGILTGCFEGPPMTISELPRITIKKMPDENVARIWIRPYFGDLIIYDLIEVKINGTTVLKLEDVPSAYFELVVNYNETYIINATVYYTYEEDGSQKTIVYQWNNVLEFGKDGIYVKETYHGSLYDSAFVEKD